MNAPLITPHQRLEYILAQLYGGQVERVLDPAYRYVLPWLTPFQRDFLEWVLDPTAPDRAAVYGGIGCGKTLGIALAAFVVAMTRAGSYSLLTTATYEDIRDTLLPACREAFQDAAVWKASERLWLFPNGSAVKLRFYQLDAAQDEASNPIEGRNVTGLLLADETQKLPPKLLDHAEDRTRGTTHDPTGCAYAPKLALIGRPGAIDWWRKAVKERGGKVFEPKTRENPHNGTRYLAKLREGRSLAEFLCLTECAPAPVKGAAYDNFIVLLEDGSPAYWPHGNLIRAAAVAGPGEVILSLDPGFGNPAVLFMRPVRLLLGAPWRARQVTAHVVLDDLGGGLEESTTPQIIQAIQRRLDARGWTARQLIADPAGLARNAQTGQSDLALFARPRGHAPDHLGPGLGVRVTVPTDPARRDVLTGVQRTQALICNAEDPPVRLLLCTDEHWRRCEAQGTEVRNLRNSLLQYTTEIAQRKGRTGRDHPSTHHADALRYYVAEGPGTWQLSGGASAPAAIPPTADELAWSRFTHEER